MKEVVKMVEYYMMHECDYNTALKLTAQDYNASVEVIKARYEKQKQIDTLRF